MLLLFSITIKIRHCKRRTYILRFKERESTAEGSADKIAQHYISVQLFATINN
jgi:hypothetical protein